jgi:hypothetical protein
MQRASWPTRPRANRITRPLALGATLTLACATPRSVEATRVARESGYVVPARQLDETRSPQPSRARGFALELERQCGRGDHALAIAARELARAQLDGGRSPEPSGVIEALRAAGAPYVWPHAWTRNGSVSERSETAIRMSEWLASFHDGGERRCGIAIEPRGATELVAGIAVDTLADLRPVPRQTRLASWVEVEAELLVASAGAKVVVLGPRGLPRSVPTSVSEQLVHARFNADQPGGWLVQVLADVDGGPRPVLEARLFAGADGRTNREASVPGEAHVPDDANPELAFELLLGAARQAEGLVNLRRDRRLDRVAREHAERMREAQRVAHDVGDGDPGERLGQAGLSAMDAGENVAHAPNAVRAQRALWSSPSHRANLLSTHFDTVGIGVAREADGSVWVCEIFARFNDGE